MKKFKKIVAVLTALAIGLVCASCSNSSGGGGDSGDGSKYAVKAATFKAGNKIQSTVDSTTIEIYEFETATSGKCHTYKTTTSSMSAARSVTAPAGYTEDGTGVAFNYDPESGILTKVGQTPNSACFIYGDKKYIVYYGKAENDNQYATKSDGAGLYGEWQGHWDWDDGESKLTVNPNKTWTGSNGDSGVWDIEWKEGYPPYYLGDGEFTEAWICVGGKLLVEITNEYPRSQSEEAAQWANENLSPYARGYSSNWDIIK